MFVFQFWGVRGVFYSCLGEVAPKGPPRLTLALVFVCLLFCFFCSCFVFFCSCVVFFWGLCLLECFGVFFSVVLFVFGLLLVCDCLSCLFCSFLFECFFFCVCVFFFLGGGGVFLFLFCFCLRWSVLGVVNLCFISLFFCSRFFLFVFKTLFPLQF